MGSRDWARPVVHWELLAADPERLRSFYAELFSWDIGDGPIMSISPGLGGPEPGPGGHIMAGGGATGFGLFVQVRDLDETIRRTTELGGAVTGGRFDIPGGASIWPIEDPEGNRITLVQQ
jgi:predicted enzyme related to lactoylglutathione lyase